MEGEKGKWRVKREEWRVIRTTEMMCAEVVRRGLV